MLTALALTAALLGPAADPAPGVVTNPYACAAGTWATPAGEVYVCSPTDPSETTADPGHKPAPTTHHGPHAHHHGHHHHPRHRA